MEEALQRAKDNRYVNAPCDDLLEAVKTAQEQLSAKKKELRQGHGLTDEIKSIRKKLAM